MPQHPREKAEFVLWIWWANAASWLLIALSAAAIGYVQIESHRGDVPTQVWYVCFFTIVESWVAAGFYILWRAFVRKDLGAGLTALAVWGLAVSVSAYQEYRFHSLRNAQISSSAALRQTTLEIAEARETELMASIAAIPIKRSQEAIRVELDRYLQQPDRFATKVAELRAELADVRDVSEQREELAKARADIARLADAGVDVAVFEKVGDDRMIWIMIALGMVLKSLGPWLASRRSPKPEILDDIANPPVAIKASDSINPDCKERWVKRRDRAGTLHRVRVPAR